MIGKEPESLDKFAIPVSGQPIPRGWFARLVAFMNSLVLRGDNQYFLVSHSNAGTTISPSKKMVDLLNAAHAAAPSSGANVTGMGAPDYSAPTAMSPGVLYGPFAYPVWVVGYIDAFVSSTIYEVYLTGPGITQYLYKAVTGYNYLAPVSLPIAAGKTFQLYTIGTADSVTLNLNYYPATQ